MPKERCFILKILVLGNGFDVDHNLPTSYANFLVFCNCVVNINLYPDAECFDKLVETQKEYIKKLAADEELKTAFLKLLQHNQLFAYFNNRKERAGSDWIDLEREISIVVSEFRTLEDAFRRSNRTVFEVDSKHRVIQLLKDLNLSSINATTWNESQFNAVHATLCKCIEDFSKALELYIAIFVNDTTILGISPDIIDFSANKILSFNYSNTYERVYGGLRWNEDIEYIHGKANIDSMDYSRIILGITTENDVSGSEYVEFEKYYQRITKRTGSNYKKWLQTRVAEDKKIEVMFFGHSLDSSDSDIIKDLICDEKTEIKIVYHSQKSYQQIVANLIDIVGKTQLIAYVSGRKPKITFVLQKDHNNGTTAGLEISRDILSLFHLYSLDEQSVEGLFKKIYQKIEEKDLSYFYSQRKVISLFDALGYHIDNTAYAKQLKEICNMLKIERRGGNAKPFAAYEWNDHTPWDEEIPCSDRTEVFIGAVNYENGIRVEEENGKRKYAYFSEIDTPEEMKNALIDVFREDTYTEEFWKGIDELVELLAENKVLEEALHLIENMKFSISKSAKLRHFKNLYDEHCYHLYMWRRAEQEAKERGDDFYGDN